MGSIRTFLILGAGAAGWRASGAASGANPSATVCLVEAAQTTDISTRAAGRQTSLGPALARARVATLWTARRRKTTARRRARGSSAAARPTTPPACCSRARPPDYDWGRRLVVQRRSRPTLAARLPRRCAARARRRRADALLHRAFRCCGRRWARSSIRSTSSTGVRWHNGLRPTSRPRRAARAEPDRSWA